MKPHLTRSTWSLFVLLACTGLARAAAPEFTVGAGNPLALATDGRGLVLAVELSAHNASGVRLQVASIDYAVSIEGVRLFAGSTQPFTVDAVSEKLVPVAGFSEASEGAVLEALRGTQRYRFLVTGTAHLRTVSGGTVDLRFSAPGEAGTPEELSRPRSSAVDRYSLVSRAQ